MKNRALRGIAAFAVSSGVLLTMPSMPFAHAETGTGGTGGNGTPVNDTFKLMSYWYDHPKDAPNYGQGTEQASIDWFRNQVGMTKSGTFLYNNIQSSCTQALTQADDRARAAGDTNPVSRVVAIEYVQGTGIPDPPNNTGFGYASSNYFLNESASWASAGYPGVDQSITAPAGQSSYGSWIQSLADGQANLQGATENISTICVALNEREPAPQNYNMTVTTDRGTVDTVMGSTMGIDDIIHANNGGSSIHENVNASVTMYVNNPDGTLNKSITKQVSIANNGDTRSPQFLPSDFGWTSWPAGGRTFSVTIPKQGMMAGDVNLNPNDPRESWVVNQPDKAWVLDANGALTTADPNRTNNVGADQGLFLPGSPISAVVNGAIPANEANALTDVSLNDNWTKAAQYVDFSKGTLAKVFFDGKDVTNQFTITVNGTQTKAVANADFLAGTKGLSKDTPIKLVVTGAFKTDYQTNGQPVTLYNDGSVTLNGTTSNTNEPPVFTVTPQPVKDVIGDPTQGAKTTASINGLSVFPGQKIDYTINAPLNLPPNTLSPVTQFAIRDAFDPNFVPDKSSVVVKDAGGNVVPASAYTLTWDDAKYTMNVEMSKDWLTANAVPGKDASLNLQFAGAIKQNVADGTTVKNQGFEVINGTSVATNVPQNTTPGYTPHKEDLNTQLQNIDKKTVMMGDHIVYRLTLDGSKPRSQIAYDVHKFGMTDHFDAEYLSLTNAGVKVVSDTGADVTNEFNVSVKNGVMQLFAKVGTVGTDGKFTPSANQPADLDAFQAVTIDPAKDGIIDQSLLGHKFSVLMDTTVIKESDGYQIKNQAFETLENTSKPTEIVSNPLKAIHPDKDVVAAAGDKDSINGKTIPLNGTFNYRLNSSTIPADRAYGSTSWVIVDKFDEAHDYYTGMWAVYADTDVYDGQTLMFHKGDVIDSSDANKGYFAANWDNDSYTLTVGATQKYMALINGRTDLAQAWSAYTKMTRIAPADKVVNTFDEFYNNTDRHSNEVFTNTPAKTGLTLVKYDLAEGAVAGNRDDSANPYTIPADGATNGVPIGFDITNTGNTPVDNVKLTDQTTAGQGKIDLSTVTCSVPASTPAGLPSVASTTNAAMPLPKTTPSASATPTGSASAAPTGSATPTASASAAPTDSASATPTTGIPTSSTSASTGTTTGPAAPAADDSATPSASPSATSTDSAVPSATPSATSTDSATPSASPSASSSASATPSASSSSSAAPASQDMKTVGADQIGTMQPGAVVKCQGLLTGVQAGVLHTDNATVNGTEHFSGKPLTASNPWNGILPAPAVPVAPGQPAQPAPAGFSNTGGLGGVVSRHPQETVAGSASALGLLALAFAGAVAAKAKGLKKVDDE